MFDGVWRDDAASGEGRARKRRRKHDRSPMEFFAALFSTLSLCFVAAVGWTITTKPAEVNVARLDAAATRLPGPTSPDTNTARLPELTSPDANTVRAPEAAGEVTSDPASLGVALYHPSDPSGAVVHGTVKWIRTTKANHPAILAMVQMPDLAAAVTLSKNHDDALAASYLMEIQFMGKFDQPAVQEIAAPLLRDAAGGEGKPLAGVPVVVTDDFFWFALTNDADQLAYDVDLLRQAKWVEIPIFFEGGTHASLVLETAPLTNSIFEDVAEATAKTTTARK
jgi:hypothetical protein